MYLKAWKQTAEFKRLKIQNILKLPQQMWSSETVSKIEMEKKQTWKDNFNWNIEQTEQTAVKPHLPICLASSVHPSLIFHICAK